MKQFKNYNLRLLAVTLIVLFIAACTNNDFTVKNSTADFSVAINDLEVSFTPNSKYAVSLTWDFGDGTTSTKVSPTHTFAQDGDYIVTLTAAAAVGGNSDMISKTISVSQINPTANFTSEIDDKTVTFTNTSERAVSNTWDFGDGETSTEENPVHTYAESGEYSVTLTTIGVDGSTPATVTKTIAVAVGSFGIYVENGDFQLPADGKHTNWDNVPGWSSDTQAVDSGVEEGDAGVWTAYRMSSDPSVYNLTEHVIAADELFHVSLEAWDGWNSSQIVVTLYYDTGDGVRNTLATQTFDLVPDQTVLFEMTGSSTTASVGANLGIMIDNVSTDGGDGWTGFDNVELSAEVAAFVSVDVENGDFQLPADGKHTNWDNVPGWSSDTQAVDSGVEEGDAGVWTAYRMSSDPSVYNLTEHVIAAEEVLKVNVEAWNGWNSSQIVVTLYYDTGDGVRNTLATQTFDLVPDQTVLFELSTTATEASVGANIGIMIDNVSTDGGDGWTGFDNVQLFAK